MLVRDPNLLLQALFFVMKFSKAVFEHLRFHLPLLQVQLLVEFARAVQSSRFIHLLGALQVLKIDVTEAEVLADELFLSHTFRRCENAEVVNDQVSVGALAVGQRRVDDVIDFGPSARRFGSRGDAHGPVEVSRAIRNRIVLLLRQKARLIVPHTHNFIFIFD